MARRVDEPTALGRADPEGRVALARGRRPRFGRQPLPATAGPLQSAGRTPAVDRRLRQLDAGAAEQEPALGGHHHRFDRVHLHPAQLDEHDCERSARRILQHCELDLRVHAIDRTHAWCTSRIRHGPTRSREPLSAHDLDEGSPLRATREPTDGVHQCLEAHTPLFCAPDDPWKFLGERAELLDVVATDSSHAGESIKPPQEPWIRGGTRRWWRRRLQDRGDRFGRECSCRVHAANERLAHEQRARAIEIDVARVDGRCDRCASRRGVSRRRAGRRSTTRAQRRPRSGTAPAERG